MAAWSLANAVSTTLQSGLASVAQGATDYVTPASKTGFPTTGQFPILIENEILLVTNPTYSASQWQVLRGQEGTTAPAHVSGVGVTNPLTAAALGAFARTDQDNSGVLTFTLSNAGSRLGIGTATPATTLDVNGSITGRTLTGGQIIFPSSAGVLMGDAGFVWDNTNKRLGIGATPSQPLHVRVAANENLWVRDNGGVLQLEAANDAGSADVPLRLSASAYYFMPGTGGGNVGIGTASPTSLLHVNGQVTTAYAPAGGNLVANYQELVSNNGADTAGMWTGIAFNLPTGANRIGGIGLVSRGVGNQKADLFFYGDDGGSRAEKLRLTAEGHLVSSGPTPTLGALQTGVASQSISGTDTRGEITFTTTASPPAANTLIASVTWANPYISRPFAMTGQGDTLPGGAAMGWITTPSTSGMGLYSAAGPVGSANYGVQYLVMG